MHRLTRRAAAVAALLAVASAPALAQQQPRPADKKPASTAAWPNKPVRILVGFPAGSTPDLVARTFAEPLSKELGQPVIVENRVGAGGNIAADAVAKATDNHTIGFMVNGNLTVAKLLNPATPFDPIKAFQPLSLIGTAPLVLGVPVNAPGATVQEFFLNARNAGEKWSYGSVGVGSVGHLGMELLKTKTNINPVHIPYQGNPQVINALIGNQIHMSLLPPALANAQVKAGKLRAIGVTSTARSPLVPDIPSLDEGGVRGFQLEIWVAAAAPQSLPKPNAQRLSTLISEIARTQEVRAKLFQQGWQTAGTSAEGLANRIKTDTNLLGGVIAMRGIKAE
ncbi:MAG: tripartite tricarboxylate transporter substrate-binding protein [Burkholderiaceae bacterium]